MNKVRDWSDNNNVTNKQQSGFTSSRSGNDYLLKWF